MTYYIFTFMGKGKRNINIAKINIVKINLAKIKIKENKGAI